MILVDSSVWIDYFNGAPTAEVERLMLGLESAIINAENFRTVEAPR